MFKRGFRKSYRKRTYRKGGFKKRFSKYSFKSRINKLKVEGSYKEAVHYRIKLFTGQG